MTRFFASIGAAVALIAAAAPAEAARFVQSTFYRTAGSPTQSELRDEATPATLTSGGANGQSLSTTDVASGGSVTASGFTTATTTDVSQYAELYYSFQIVGAGGDEFVPLNVVANGNVSGSGAAYSAFIQFLLDQANNNAGIADNRSIGSATGLPPGPQTLAINTTLMFRPNVDINVALQASSTAGFPLQNRGDNSATAFLDPIFTIDPAYAGRYRLVGVLGAEAAGVPEPASWAMMVGGFGLVGGVLRRRGRGVVAAA